MTPPYLGILKKWGTGAGEDARAISEWPLITGQQACAEALKLVASVMNRGDITKAGVQCVNDAKRMRLMCVNVRPKNVVDVVVRHSSGQ